MSNYVPWYGKKKQHVEQREDELLRLLAKVGMEKAVTRAAEELREARVRALKSDRSRIEPCDRGDNAERRQRLDEQISRCSAQPIEEILAEYRERFRKASTR